MVRNITKQMKISQRGEWVTSLLDHSCRSGASVKGCVCDFPSLLAIVWQPCRIMDTEKERRQITSGVEADSERATMCVVNCIQFFPLLYAYIYIVHLFSRSEGIH